MHLKCEMCGLIFDVNQSKGGCAGCPMSRSCKKIKYPNCNHEMYPKPELKIAGLIKG
jgi:hypothetical protein